MTKNLGYTYEMAVETAAQYQWKTEFQKAHRSLWAYAYRRGWWSDMCQHMNTYVPKPVWTEELIRKTASETAAKTDFTRRYPGAYARALKMGIVDEICAHMTNRNPTPTEFENGRKCKDCGVFKSKVEMVRNPNSKSGIGTICRKCNTKRGIEHCRKNVAWKRAHTALRRAKRAKATPPWITKDHKKQITLLYKQAKELTDSTGIAYEVDHIIPIAGKNVCGLHLPVNLQVITREENRAKLNKFDQSEAIACFS